MTYFLPTFFQKRLLRYTLSRLDLLDPEQLDLEKLDITWGKRSVIELRDVGLQLPKLSALLRVPHPLVLVKANISLLRISVPADLYQNGVLVEVEGLEIQIRARQTSRENAHSEMKKAQQEVSQKDAKLKQPRNTRIFVHDPGGVDTDSVSQGMNSDSEQRDGIPTTDDLATSFLQTETKEEKAQLQAAIVQSQNLEETEMHDSIPDETSALGVGTGLSLPRFLASFLEGVGDRLQLKVKELQVDILFDLDIPFNKSTITVGSDKSEPVLFRMMIEKLEIEALKDDVCSPEAHLAPLNAIETEKRNISRQIRLSRLHGMFISDSSVFETLSRPLFAPSPDLIIASSPQGSFRKTDDQQDELSSATSLTGTYFANYKSHHSSFPKTEDAADTHSWNNSRRSGQASRNEIKNGAATSQLSPDKDTRGFREDLYSKVLDMGKGMATQQNIPEADLIPTRIQSRSSSGFSTPRLGLENEALPAMPFSQTDDEPFQRSLEQSDESGLKLSSSTESGNPGGTNAEDLTQSRIFSHEEAESMYMSAISYEDMENYSERVTVPGGWDFNSENGVDSKHHEPNFNKSMEGYELSKTEKTEYLEQSIDLDEALADQMMSHRSSQEPQTTLPRHSSNRGIVPESFLGAQLDNTSAPFQLSSPIESQASNAGSESLGTIAKEVLFADSITLHIPQARTSAMSTSSKHGEEASTIPEYKSGATDTPHRKIARKDLSSQLASSIDVGNVEFISDIALLKLFTFFTRQVLEISDASDSEPQATNITATDANLRLRLRHISWKLYDIVRGSPTSRSNAEWSSWRTRLPNMNADVLLRVTVHNLNIVYQKKATSVKLQSTIGKAALGYLSEDIISFDHSSKMRESTRDILAPIGNDIAIDIDQTPETLKVDVTTLPVRIDLDLPRMDETLSWLGGFSTVLGLGSSMVATATAFDKKSRKKSPSTRHVVRFDVSEENSHLHGEMEVKKKCTARLGGLVCVISARENELRLEGSAIKFVSRNEGLALQIDRLHISHWLRGGNSSGPAMSIKLSNTRTEYLSTPREVDLDRLIAVLCPSKEDNKDNGILMDTLLRQRRQGAVVRLTVENVESRISNLGCLRGLSSMAEDLKKISTVAKYLPQDDRPGILTLFLIRSLNTEAIADNSSNIFKLFLSDFEVAHVTFPSLVATGIRSIQLYRNDENEKLLSEAPQSDQAIEASLPRIMCRYIHDEMEPMVKIRLQNVQIDYHVTTAMAIMELVGQFAADGAVSSPIANSKARQHTNYDTQKVSTDTLSSNEKLSMSTRAMGFDLIICDTIIGLNPHSCISKGLLVLADTHLTGHLTNVAEALVTLHLKKGLLMVTDNQSHIKSTEHQSISRVRAHGASQTDIVQEMGYVFVGSISAAKASIRTAKGIRDSIRLLDVELNGSLLVLETCADSTQTLQDIITRLHVPRPPESEAKYRTEVIPVENMLASLTGNAFASDSLSADDNKDHALDFGEKDVDIDDVPPNLDYVSSFYSPVPVELSDSFTDDVAEDNLEISVASQISGDIGKQVLSESLQDQSQAAPDKLQLEFRDSYFGTSPEIEEAAQEWDKTQNIKKLAGEPNAGKSQTKFRLHDIHIIWNLYDGYDWQGTRDKIRKAVSDVENKALKHMSSKEKKTTGDKDREQESVIGDCLFNSIYIGIPANREPAELTKEITRNIDGLNSETDSPPTSITSGTPRSQSPLRSPSSRRDRFARSKHHKIAIELKGISTELTIFSPPLKEIQSSVNIRVQDIEIFDHLPTSTWKKFATYMQDAGERESGTSMVDIEILNVKPVPDLAASEIVLKATFLPLRLHVDQDALDFLTRFFEFKYDDPTMSTPKSEPAFFQRVEINSIRVKLDFKPKRVNYTGIRSGHTNEFMNFFILDRADMILRHSIIYGVSGFDRLGKTLNDIWMPDIKKNQLPGVLAGLAPVRSLVNVGGGVRDIIVVPVREYRKDGRVVRSFQKGALAFARTTTSELTKLGAKLAIGTQSLLQGAEQILSQPQFERRDVYSGWQDAHLDEEEKKQISLYADQPIGVMHGLRGAYASLERDLLTAKDAIVAMPGEIMESRSAGDAARAVLRGAPTVILRPALGLSKAVGQTLMGATNSLDPANRRRIEEIGKRAAL
ncbi:MAG: hypothetical protein Q9167_002517 [Letrouitia subvulpina]